VLRLGLLYAERSASARRPTSYPQPIAEAILPQLFAGAACGAVEPGEHLRDRFRVFLLRRHHANRQAGRWAKWHFREKTPAKRSDGFDSSFVEALGWNPNGVLDALGVGE
jgi:hypothetical protein